jgi:hypothetical protein
MCVCRAVVHDREPVHARAAGRLREVVTRARLCRARQAPPPSIDRVGRGRLIGHQPVVLFSQNKPATCNQPAVLSS